MCFSSTDLNKHDTYEVSVTDKWSQKFSDEVMQIMHAVITSGSFEHQQLNMLSQTE
jgi:ribosome biogenesis GTPase A